MKVKRSLKNQEIMSPRKRRNRRSVKRRRALNQLNAVNETIVLSDSDEVQSVNDDDIEVIDVAEATNTIKESDSDITECDSGGRPVNVKTVKSEDLPVEPPVINIEDEPDCNDDDGVEVVAVLPRPNMRMRRESSKRPSLKRKLSFGNLSQMQDIIKKAKNTVRRSSSINSKNSDPIFQSLKKISANSRHIRRNNNNARKNNQFGNFQGRKRYGQFKNRSRENGRQIILRPGGNNQQNRNFVPTNFSFESNPFMPTNSSTPVPVFGREEHTSWMPIRRLCPLPIEPGSNIMNAGETVERPKGTLRPVVIDGSNIAVGHSRVLQGGNRFSARGIKICIDYFKRRGHNEIIAFVPRYRLKKAECDDPELLEELERQGNVRFTPSREAGGQRFASYDDLFVVEYAHQTNGIIISNDNFKDLYEKKHHLQSTIKFRLLQYTWITQDVIMFPEDPLGRNGPSLDEFLRF